VEATLHQATAASKLDRLRDLFEDLVEFENISFLVARFAIERTKCADGSTDVGVIDIPVDDVGDNSIGMPFFADPVRCTEEIFLCCMLDQCQRLRRDETVLSCDDRFEQVVRRLSTLAGGCRGVRGVVEWKLKLQGEMRTGWHRSVSSRPGRRGGPSGAAPLGVQILTCLPEEIRADRRGSRE